MSLIATSAEYATKVTTEDVQRWMRELLETGQARATVNRKTEILRAGLRLAHKNARIASVPYIPKLRERNERMVFIPTEHFDAICEHLPEPFADVARFAFWTAWRASEIKSLTWDMIDRTESEILLPDSKNGESRRIPMCGAVAELIERRWNARRYRLRNGQEGLATHVFHRNGAQLGDHQGAWKKACQKSGFSGCRDGYTFHDLRRTANRNMRNAGVPTEAIKAIGGWKTDAVFSRYSIVDTSDRRRAFEALESYVTGERDSDRKVVPMRRATPAASASE